MTLLDFLALALASHAWVDVWRNGSIFDSLRAYMEARADADLYESNEQEDQEPDGTTPRWMRLLNAICPRWFAELVSCSFCFSHHTPWVLAVSLYFPSLFVETPWDWLLKMPIYALACTRLGTIINAIVPDADYERDAEGFLITNEDTDDGPTPAPTPTESDSPELP